MAKVLLAVVAAVVAYIICIALGTLLVSFDNGLAVALGGLLKGLSFLIGLVVGVYYFAKS